MHAQIIREVGAMLPRFVGCINVTKIHICQPGGHNSIQQSVYYGHKRVQCLLFCAVTKPDGLIFYCDGPVERRRPDLFSLEYTGLDNALSENLLIEGHQ